MAWVQVYVKGLPKSIEPSDEEIESLLDERYGLSSDGSITWAGKETTQIKRDDGGCCRGFAFLAFYSAEGAAAAVDRINSFNGGAEGAQMGHGDAEEGDGGGSSGRHLPLRLSAELSKPKTSNKKKGKKEGGEDLRDLRFRRQRKAPVRKHPVVTSSDGKRTNLGNKTK
ncbi:hypothetical protein ACHAWF_001288 [Thalassiosira exigua]